ncbi:MAG: hypothetical protein K2K27_06755 [Muribaculaceae bacterium]|nr:hypothetical protein [Muribaculaceae bacterium]
MKNFLRSCVAVILASFVMPAFSQTFPDYFELANYDMAKSSKSYLMWMNDDASTPSTYNDAVIFATSVNKTDRLPSDLLRLTIGGVATFNSPFPGYSQSIELRNQGTMQGRFRIAGTMLDIEGRSAVNIGTTAQPFLFQVNDQRTQIQNRLDLVGNGRTISIGVEANQQSAWIGTRSDVNLKLGVNSGNAITIENSTKNVYIGVSDNRISTIPQTLKSNYGLFVEKGILSEDYSIAPVSSWADFVFSPDYKLQSLDEVENFINENGHLPSVPSAAEVARDGYSQVEMTKILLQKIEELNLYVIQQKKEIDALKAKLAE